MLDDVSGLFDDVTGTAVDGVTLIVVPIVVVGRVWVVGIVVALVTVTAGFVDD